MPVLTRAAFSLIAGLMLAVGYNGWLQSPDQRGATYAANDRGGLSGGDNLDWLVGAPQVVELWPYAIGMMVGMALWQFTSVHWNAMPSRFHAYLAAKTNIYQFAVIGTACIAILFYL